MCVYVYFLWKVLVVWKMYRGERMSKVRRTGISTDCALGKNKNQDQLPPFNHNKWRVTWTVG